MAERPLHVCVFCGSNTGFDPAYAQVATHFGRLIAERNAVLVYGGGRVGLMGLVADAALSAGGRVIGVIPEFLDTREIAHAGVTELIRSTSMHTRKAKMVELSDQFVALPGGLGTFDEFCEIVTWAQLGLHGKPVGLLNVRGYFDGLIAQIERSVADGFCREEHQRLFLVDEDGPRLLQALETFQPPQMRKWIAPDQT